ncbi:hypothetical protein M899_3009 [Bacteriovorax sp. BSW11_IV]|uniref:hypothetical protein n=1 Tax=Bacteriovorax sp. BSW11_IV TaxID=1353529 RepID=UPI000389EBF1|nr:hypothetical protein [Bacteriovorax sp. BSW11_IV]EQC49920.1 hypothetical protein M899_3009 [Bacteriovorax sp. BSW11_IV]
MKNYVRKITGIVFLVIIYGIYARYMMNKEGQKVQSQVQAEQQSVGENQNDNMGNGFMPVADEKHFNLTLVDSVLDECFKTNQELTKNFESIEKFKSVTMTKLGAFKEKSFSWQNIHFEAKDGSLMRLRVFMDDGPNGERKKLVLFKEDADGFPNPVIIDEKDIWEPSMETIGKYIADNKVLFDELAEAMVFENGDVFLKKVGGKIMEAQINTATGNTQCKFE